MDFLDNLPSSNGVPTGLKRAEKEQKQGLKPQSQFHQSATELLSPATLRRTEMLPSKERSITVRRGGEELVYSLTHPKITAFQSMILFSDGAPLTPVGGSS